MTFTLSRREVGEQTSAPPATLLIPLVLTDSNETLTHYPQEPECAERLNCDWV